MNWLLTQAMRQINLPSAGAAWRRRRRLLLVVLGRWQDPRHRIEGEEARSPPVGDGRRRRRRGVGFEEATGLRGSASTSTAAISISIKSTTPPLGRGGGLGILMWCQLTKSAGQGHLCTAHQIKQPIPAHHARIMTSSFGLSACLMAGRRWAWLARGRRTTTPPDPDGRTPLPPPSRSD